MESNKDYKKIKVKTNNKVFNAIEIKKKSRPNFCKRFIKQISRSNSNSSIVSDSESRNSSSPCDIKLLVYK